MDYSGASSQPYNNIDLNIIDADGTVFNYNDVVGGTLAAYTSQTVGSDVLSGMAVWPVRLSGSYLTEEFPDLYIDDGDPFVAVFLHNNATSAGSNNLQNPTGAGSYSVFGSIAFDGELGGVAGTTAQGYDYNNIPSAMANDQWEINFLTPPIDLVEFTSGVAIHLIMRTAMP